MEPEGTQTGSSGSHASTRLRLVDLNTSSGSFPFGGGLACVLTTPNDRHEIATHISSAVIGPRGSDVSGTLEIAGRLVSLQSLPSPLLGPSAAITIDQTLLEQIWRSACAGRRAELEAAHAARRLDRHRSEAALERVRQRAREMAERATAPVVAPLPAVNEPDPFDEIAPRIETTLDALAALELVPSPVAYSLADEFDALAVYAEELAARPPEVDEDIAPLEERLATARYAVAHNAGGVPPEARARIEACHRDVVAAESALFEAKRKDRSDALTRYQSSLAAEHAALDDAGVDSYASFLVAIAQGAPRVDPEVRLRLELDLAQAQNALDAARRERGIDPNDDPEHIEIELRARAAQLLARFPGTDPAAELRALRVPSPGEDRLRDELREMLTSTNVPVSGDVVTAAIEALDAHAAAAAAAVSIDDGPVPLGALDSDAASEQLKLHNETVMLARECDDHERALADLELQLADVDRLRITDLGSLDPASTHLMVDTFLDAYRNGDLLAGRLPLVLDGAFDRLDVGLIAAKLSRVDDVQVVVITAKEALANALATAGAVVVSATNPPDRNAVSAPEPKGQGSPVGSTGGGAACVRHADKVAAAQCSQCGRPSCIDCLVYVPGEPELWCVTCADAMRSRNLRLLRRRGA